MAQLNMEELLTSIRTKCSREHWYGPEMKDPDWFEKFDRNGRIPHTFFEPHNAPEHSQRFEFTAPPLSEEQFCNVEERIGHALAQFFRLVYEQIANGGFGPGYYGLADALSFASEEHGEANQEDAWPTIDLADCICNPEWSRAYRKGLVGYSERKLACAVCGNRRVGLRFFFVSPSSNGADV